jgi:hypothetical protein
MLLLHRVDGAPALPRAPSLRRAPAPGGAAAPLIICDICDGARRHTSSPATRRGGSRRTSPSCGAAAVGFMNPGRPRTNARHMDWNGMERSFFMNAILGRTALALAIVMATSPANAPCAPPSSPAAGRGRRAQAGRRRRGLRRHCPSAGADRTPQARWRRRRWPRCRSGRTAPAAYGSPPQRAEAIGKVTIVGVKPHGAVVALGHNAEAVVLDLVNPTRPGRWLPSTWNQS